MAKTDCQFKITIQLKQAIEKDARLITHINIPCGKCGRCIQRRKMEWGFRMQNELIHSKTAYFVTLTYAPEYVPYNKYGQKTLIPTRKIDLEIKAQEEGRKRKTKKWKESCVDRSIQGFIKRVRQNQKRIYKKDITIETITNGLDPSDKIKYYAAGEYGEERGRPHYHLIMFNASRRAIEMSWQLGGIDLRPATHGEIAYTMKYLDKQIGQEKTWNKEPEFSTMSEGIGENYIKKNKQWHKNNLHILYVCTSSGIRIPMPKWFREKMFTEDERKKQVLLVTEKLDEIKEELIHELGGMHEYNKYTNELKKESERRFIKKIKKRIID